MSLGWSYLPPLKGTAAVSFQTGRLKNGIVSPQTNEVLMQLTRMREEMLNSMKSFDTSEETVRKYCLDYLEALQGLVEPLASCLSANTEVPIEPKAVSPASGDPTAAPPVDPPPVVPPPAVPPPASTTGGSAEKLRYAVLFKWFDNITALPVEQSDAQFEKTCVLINLGLWLAKHATKLAQTRSDDEDIGKQIYRASRLAASVFEHVSKVELGKFPYSPNTDLDERIIEGRIQQLLAEAQEVTIERGRRKNNSPELIAGLAHDNYMRFTSALNKISSVDEQYVGDLRRYLKFKIKFHEAYAYCFTGQYLFAQEKCGEAIRAYQQSKEACGAAEKAARDYVKLSTRKLNMTFQNFLENPIYLQLGKEITIHSDKAERENSFIYHHKVPTTDLEMLPPKSLIATEPFAPPPVSTLFWAKAKFDITKIYKKGENLAIDTANSSDSAAVTSLGTDTTGSKKTGEFCAIS